MSRFKSALRHSVSATVATAMLVGVPTGGIAAPAKRRPAAMAMHQVHVAQLPSGTQRPTTEVALSVGRGELITTSEDVSDVWISNSTVADVDVTSARQIHLFGKAPGEATVFATTKSGRVAYATNVRIGKNENSIAQMLRLAMPEAAVTATTMNGLVLLTGTVAQPSDSEEAERLVKALVGDQVTVLSHLKTATPLQVNLQVKIAEVSRSLAKSIKSNLTSVGRNGISVSQGRDFGTITSDQIRGAPIASLPQLDASSVYGLPAGSVKLPFDPVSGRFVTGGAPNINIKGLGAGTTTLGFLGHLFGLDAAAAFDLAETDGLVTLLAEPNLTALSGETANFLAGGEFPIPISQQLGQVSIEYKQFGVSLAFTPTVLADGRISMRVRPEVSQLSSEGAVTLNGFNVPALTTRREETTVELGSGQSFMIGGLLQNNNVNSIEKAPGLGDVPVLGALFRSNGYRRSQTELMIIVTPYLVKPVSANEIALPTDGFKTPNDLQNFLLGQDFAGKSGAKRPMPRLAPPVTVPANPGVGASLMPATPSTRGRKSAASTAAPGFSN